MSRTHQQQQQQQQQQPLSEDYNEMADPIAPTTPAPTTNSTQDHQQAKLPSSTCSHRRHHQRRPSGTTMFNLNRKSAISGFVCLVLAVFLLAPPTTNQLVEGAKIKKAVKSIAKGLIFQSLSTKKNFLPLPVPIPVPIEINEDPIYLKGKPKYVNVYKPPKPTAAPVVKPTTVYHMPIYSPTYEYMSMDPMNSMYGAQMMYNPYSVSGPSSYKSSVNTDSDSTSSVASASHGGASYGGVNFNDYDDEGGSYYMKKAAARRRKLMPGEYASSVNMHRVDMDQQRANIAAQMRDYYAGEAPGNMASDRLHANFEQEEDDIESALPNDDESYDHEGDGASGWAPDHGSMHRGRRVKRQVYYESGYDGNTNCEGFPLEINVRSRIKLDRIFPIFGKSQMRKCVKIKKTLMPPQDDEY